MRLGLIGDAIAASRAPDLHERAGRLLGVPVRYNRLVPRDLDMDFAQVFARARDTGLRGLNITYPYKERVMAHLRTTSPRVSMLGAANTVVFEASGPKGYNTDWSGFIAAYRAAFGTREAGEVCLIGAGGMGRAVAFGLLEFGLRGLRIFDRDVAKAQALSSILLRAAPDLDITVPSDLPVACDGVQGLVNCTPVGMDFHPGTPLPRGLMAGASWAFDAIYTPARTQFLHDASEEGLDCLTGTELFFHQGLHAVEIFHGRSVSEEDLRRVLAA